jgi:3-oxoacyl-[acyl-carrier protein] reductase
MAVALVTGASRGIGRAIALRLAQDGHDVAIGYRSQADAAAEVADLVRQHGARATTVAGDLREADGVKTVIRDSEAELGPIEILVANAGINSEPRGIAEVTPDAWDEIHAINLKAPFLLARALAPAMCERGFGRIVFISSIAAYNGGIVGPHYAASKAGLHGLAYSLAAQSARQGVTANVVAPALVESDMIPNDPQIRESLLASSPVGRLGQPDEVADMVAAVVRNGYLTGRSILLDGGRYPA